MRNDRSRPPCGGRGLKYPSSSVSAKIFRSPPVWGAWVEILPAVNYESSRKSPPVWGAWVEMPCTPPPLPLRGGRPPCGGRGLKYAFLNESGLAAKSPPVWGAWVEILLLFGRLRAGPGRPPCGGRGLKCLRKAHCPAAGGRPPCGGRGLKLQLLLLQRPVLTSPPVWGAWVEIWRERSASAL